MQCYNCGSVHAPPLISLQGCVPQLVSHFHYILNVVTGVSITVGVIPTGIMAVVVGSCCAWLLQGN